MCACVCWPKAVKANETLGRIVIELVAGLVGRQFLAVKAVFAFPADDRRLALEELDPRQCPSRNAGCSPQTGKSSWWNALNHNPL